MHTSLDSTFFVIIAAVGSILDCRINVTMNIQHYVLDDEQ